MSLGKDKKIEISSLYANIELFFECETRFYLFTTSKKIISQIHTFMLRHMWHLAQHKNVTLYVSFYIA